MAARGLRFAEAHVDGGENAARNGQQMGREDDLALVDADLLKQFAGVAMGEDAVGGEIVGRVHEVRLGGGRFARAADAALGVGDDAVVEIDEARGNQRPEGEDDRGCVAAGVGDEARAGDLMRDAARACRRRPGPESAAASSEPSSSKA